MKISQSDARRRGISSRPNGGGPANGLPTRNTVLAPYHGFPVGCLVQQLDTGAPTACGEVAGPGALLLIPNRSAGASHGEIRVKLVPLDPPGP